MVKIIPSADRRLSTTKNNLATQSEPAYVVNLQSEGNPDFGEDSNRSISPTLKAVAKTLAECSVVCQKYIAKFNLGGGNWVGGQIYHPDKGLVGHVSYNGRVWRCTDEKKMYDMKTPQDEFTPAEISEPIS